MKLPVLALLFLLSICPPAQPGCSPTEEGQPSTITCDIKIGTCHRGANYLLSWRTDANDADINLCYVTACGGGLGPLIHATPTPAGSTLIFKALKRTDVPFNLESRYYCIGCDYQIVTACEKLEIYVKPENDKCFVQATYEGTIIKSVTIHCRVRKVYPKALCEFFHSTPQGKRIGIARSVEYSHQVISSKPLLYSATCTNLVSAAALGLGTHRFMVHIYPDVTNGRELSKTIFPGDKTVTISGPRCSPVEEGHPTTMICEIKIKECGDTILTWRAHTTTVDVAHCSRYGCHDAISDDISATISQTSSQQAFNKVTSTLTVNKVTRTNDPFNMETDWTCEDCLSEITPACYKLEVYAKPVTPTCVIEEEHTLNDTLFFNLSCSTNKVYPKAKCSLYRVEILTMSTYVSNICLRAEDRSECDAQV